jgi:hypothetical protein
MGEVLTMAPKHPVCYAGRMPTGNEESGLVREIDNLRGDIQSLSAKFDSIQKTLVGDFSGRLGRLEQFQATASGQMDAVAVRDEKIAVQLKAIQDSGAMLERSIMDKLSAMNTTRAGERERAERERGEQREKDEKARSEALMAVNKQLDFHGFVIKIVCVVAALLASGLVAAGFSYVKSNALAVERLERLESTAPSRSSRPEK